MTFLAAQSPSELNFTLFAQTKSIEKNEAVQRFLGF